MKIAMGVVSIVLSGFFSTTAFAQVRVRGGDFMLHFSSFSPIAALVAGILILVFPKLLRIIVGCYLVLIGLLGILGR